MKYVYKDKYFMGITGRMYQANREAYERFNTSGKEQNLTDTFEIIFNRTQRLKPDLGIDGRLSQPSHMVNFIRASENLGIVTLKGECITAWGSPRDYSGSFNMTVLAVTLMPRTSMMYIIASWAEPIGKFWTLDFGILMKLYLKVKIFFLGVVYTDL